MLRLFKFKARTSRPEGVVGRERPPPTPELPKDSLRTRFIGPLFLLLLLLTEFCCKGREFRRLMFPDLNPELEGADISWIGSRLEERMGEPKRMG